MKILVTGNAGFIGFHTAQRLIERGDEVTGIDMVNNYYEIALKEKRLEQLEETARKSNGTYNFIRADLSDPQVTESAFEEGKFDRVIHLAAQPGVRYSLENPGAYVRDNVVAFTNILEGCRNTGVGHLVYASTSSVYGANTQMPFSESHGANHPVQLYAATKRANELMAHSYSHLFQLPTTGLRFFTVYGPWGRPDMALFSFTRNIVEGKPIKVFNYGKHVRDFTYIDDIVEGVIRTTDKIATSDPAWDSDNPDPATSIAPYRIFNIGNNDPVELSAYIAAIEKALGMEAKQELLPMQKGDVPNTFADVSKLIAHADYQPSTPVEEGVAKFVEWFRDYYGV